MIRVFKRSLLLSTAMIGCTLASAAQASTTTNLTITSVQAIAGQCQISFTANVAFSSADNNGADQFRTGIGPTNGPVAFGSLTQSLFGGSTSVSRSIAIAPTQQATAALFVLVEDRIPNGSFFVEERAQIPTSSLQSAGGACLMLIPNAPPVANAGPDQTVRELAPVTLDGSGSSDPEGQPLTYAWVVSGGLPVTLTGANTANPTFTAPTISANNNSIFQLTVSDGVSSRTDTVTVNYIDNIAPVASPPVPFQTVTGGSTVTLQGAGSDGNNDPLTYRWSYLGSNVPLTAPTLSNPNSQNPSFVAPVKTTGVQELYFSLIVNDGFEDSVAAQVQVNIAANVAPVANAGTNFAAGGGTTATLNGTASNGGDGDPITYSWTQVSGPTATLTGATTATPSFTVPAASNVAQTMTFRLFVSDGLATSFPSDVTVTIPTNAPPVVNAGPDATVTAGSLVTLSGSGTDLENDPISFAWSQNSGTPVTLTGATTLNPTFTAPAKTASSQVLTFALTGNDGNTTGQPDTVDITVPANVGPTANAGPPQTVGGGTPGTLNGSGSTDGDGDTLTYSWVQTGGPPVTITGANSATASFTAPPSTLAAQTLTFSLTVSDGIGSNTASTTVTIPVNGAPMVSAGPDVTVPGGSQVTLAGTATDPESDPLTYQWTQLGGPTVTLTGATTLTPSFTAPARTGSAQVLTFVLTANDGTSTSAPDSIDVTIPANVTPVANAGLDVTVNGGSQVTLNGAGSADGDGDTLTYQWVQTGGPPVTLSSSTVANPTFTTPIGGALAQTITFDLVVSDGIASSAPDSVTISVNPNAAPVANAGADQGPINSGQTVTLNGSGSSDPDNNPLTYQWTQISGPPVTLSNAAAANPSFVAPNVTGTQNLVFQLVVNDGTVNSQPDTVTIAVRAVGTITIIQRVVGADSSFSFTSDVTPLAGTIITTNGTGQRAATQVFAGQHTLAAADTRPAGYALTSISCNDSDSVVNLANRSVAITLSPNENLVCTFTSADTRTAATLAIRNFLTARNAAILASQPDLQRRLDRLNGMAPGAGSASAYGVPIPGSGHLPFQLTLGNSGMRASASLGMASSALRPGAGGSAFDIWAEGYLSTLGYAGHQGRFSIVYVGADYRVGDGLLIGGLVQFDRFSHRGGWTPGTADGKGWMAGPYATVRLAPRLYADLRAAWGTSDNQVSPLGTFVDGFGTHRALYSGSLIGDFDLGTNTGIRPEVTVRYLDERQKGYVDTFGVSIPGQRVGQGDISFRPHVYHLFDLGGDWTLRPFAEGEGIYTFGLDPANVLGSDFRMRIEGGADIVLIGRFRIGVSGFHDGIGGGSYENSGVHVTLSLGR
ncbi:PKD domain-containing protein [Sphingomonas sp. LB-2]|uniref:PKD domain-containing protein n=1 Tax=Sphingomonas caeni TaxID=2984949 RepID=UPI0022304136|nr:PKD domain-containing protein [Sphingomonas caeni]MCW3849048.1 PKD domain-containing protein [Sphingomonas caeni]